jgi:O-acetyl-ADP-ribose deacetylase (regulator of RNase III)
MASIMTQREEKLCCVVAWVVSATGTPAKAGEKEKEADGGSDPRRWYHVNAPRTMAGPAAVGVRGATGGAIMHSAGARRTARLPFPPVTIDAGGDAMIEIVRADITTLPVDAIVNAANSALRGGGGVDGAIHRAAGPGLLAELRRYDHCPPGDAVLTAGYALPARFVIHAVGPVWDGGRYDEPALLRSAYERSFALARAEGSIRSIAFPAISTGVYGYPKLEAAMIAVDVMRQQAPHFDRVVACLFDEESVRIYESVAVELDDRH